MDESVGLKWRKRRNPKMQIGLNCAFFILLLLPVNVDKNAGKAPQRDDLILKALGIIRPSPRRSNLQMVLIRVIRRLEWGLVSLVGT